MGLLDALSGLTTGDNLGDLGMIGGLLSQRVGEGGASKIIMPALALKMQQQNQERQNRANDLQQLQGAYSMLKQQEFAKMLQARQQGIPYTPNPMLPQMEAKLAELTGLGNLSAKLNPAAAVPPVQMPQMQQRPPMAAPGMAPPSASPMANPDYQPPAQAMHQRAMAPQPPQVPPQPTDGIGGPAGGIGMDWWLAQDASGKSYLEQLAKDHAPQNVRPGGSLAVMGPDGKYNAAFYAPQLGAGMQPQRDATGQVASASLIPGYLQGLAAVKSAESGAAAAGKLPFQTPTVVNTPGQPTLMTPRQQITEATGQDPLSPIVSPQLQTNRNASQLAILQRERQNATDPKDVQALDTQIQALTRAQGSGNPFVYSRPGLPLQDNTAQKAQETLGDSIGKEAGNVFIAGAASVQAKRALAGMTDMAKSYDPGKFQPLKSQLAQYAAPFVGEDTANKILSTNTGDIQGLTSAAIALAGKLTRQTDAQPSQLQFMKTLESMPMADRTPQGFARIMDYLNSMHDYNIEKMVALQQYLGKNNGDPSGFEAEWAKKSKDLPFPWNNPPQAASSDPRVVSVNGKAYRFPSTQAAAAFKQMSGAQ